MPVVGLLFECAKVAISLRFANKRFANWVMLTFFRSRFNTIYMVCLEIFMYICKNYIHYNHLKI